MEVPSSRSMDLVVVVVVVVIGTVPSERGAAGSSVSENSETFGLIYTTHLFSRRLLIDGRTFEGAACRSDK